MSAGPIALVFGTEMHGISPVVETEADLFVRVPMYGFTESLNISVCAALCMKYLADRIRRSEIDWSLTEDERVDLLLAWSRASIKEPDLLIERFERDSGSDPEQQT